MGAIKNLSIEAYRAFREWEDEKYGDNTPLADMHVDMWVDAYMLGHANGVKSQYLPKEETSCSNKAALCGEVLSTKEEQ